MASHRTAEVKTSTLIMFAFIVGIFTPTIWEWAWETIQEARSTMVAAVEGTE